ncbi:MAG: hypothetical protein SAL07_25730 [Oscillatoria sp. PMC 1051.18]|nr:hypothetical protein [Oscillatoria sp. PMC 1050.18]MEC5033309.1 hypothetical protein [Oscillatoria sp. PMC 1051.18]
MNALLPRFVKLAYRKEPISSFILIIGVVDAVIGGVGERWTLASFGITVMLAAIAVRWWQTQRHQDNTPDEGVRAFLPPSSSNAPLPLLTTQKKRRH